MYTMVLWGSHTSQIPLVDCIHNVHMSVYIVWWKEKWSKYTVKRIIRFVSFFIQGEISYTLMIPATKNYKLVAHFENHMLGSCILEGSIRQGVDSFPIRITLTGRYTCASNCFMEGVVEGVVNGSDPFQLRAGLASIVFTGITSVNVSLVSKHVWSITV